MENKPLKKIFIGTPYGKDKDIQDVVHGLTMRVCVMLAREGYVPMCPIQICHPLVRLDKEAMTFPDEHWVDICNRYMDGCDEMYVLMLNGWQDSPGLKKEVEYAQSIGIPVYYKTVSVAGE